MNTHSSFSRAKVVEQIIMFIKMKLIFAALIVTFFAISCSITGHSEQFSGSISVSNGFRALWKDLEADSHGFKAMDTYVPSATLISKYALRKTNNKYTISGFIQLNPDFDDTAFKNIGGTLVSYSGTFKSFSVPLNQIRLFVHLKGIKRIEMNTKINITN